MKCIWTNYHVFKEAYYLISDSDSTFLSKQFQQLLEHNDTIHNTVPVGDHHSLGIIARFAWTLKHILSKQREVTKSLKCFNLLDKFSNICIITEHNGLNNLTPNEASQQKHIDKIVQLNIDKFKVNKIQFDLIVGDKVGILDRKLFKKVSPL